MYLPMAPLTAITIAASRSISEIEEGKGKAMTGYVFSFQGHEYDPNGRVSPPFADANAHNRALEAAELAKWRDKPDRWAVYVEGDRAITWLGTDLGHVIRLSTYRLGRDNRVTTLRVQGNNGACYAGRYGSDWSSLCRIRRIKP
jgi:hypothetical protein